MGLFLAFHTLVDNYLLGRPDALATGAAISGFSVAFGSIGCSSSARHLPIVLVKVAYYASGSARFLPKLCSNYARFSKLCYFFKKLFCAQTSQLTRQV